MGTTGSRWLKTASCATSVYDQCINSSKTVRGVCDTKLQVFCTQMDILTQWTDK